MFEREDWTIFRNLSTISQKAGVPLNRLRRLVIKELVDNALDANPGKRCEIRKIDDNTYSVADTGPGISGAADDIANLFSIRRPLMSSKVLRRPSRGALGNGIRVISGVILASGQLHQRASWRLGTLAPDPTHRTELDDLAAVFGVARIQVRRPGCQKSSAAGFIPGFQPL